jgi:hypothetical protein
VFFAQIDLPDQVENLIRIGVKTLMVSNVVDKPWPNKRAMPYFFIENLVDADVFYPQPSWLKLSPVVC